MAISQEAYDYLNEIERIPKWTSIPDTDERIMKLRVLFGAPVNKSYGGRKPKRMRAIKNGKTIIFDDVHHCAEVLGLKSKTINKYITIGKTLKGYVFERIEND